MKDGKIIYNNLKSLNICNIRDIGKNFVFKKYIIPLLAQGKNKRPLKSVCSSFLVTIRKLKVVLKLEK